VCFIEPSAQPAAGLVWKIKQTIFVFLLKLLSEGACDSFFNAPPDHLKKVKIELQHLA
jgi:hypothetical protein